MGNGICTEFVGLAPFDLSDPMKNFTVNHPNGDCTNYRFINSGKRYSVYVRGEKDDLRMFVTSGSSQYDKDLGNHVDRILKRITDLKEETIRPILEFWLRNVEKLERKEPARLEAKKPEIIRFLAESFTPYDHYSLHDRRMEGILLGIQIHAKTGGRFIMNDDRKVWFTYDYQVREAAGYDRDKVLLAMEFVTEWFELNYGKKVSEKKSFNATLVHSIVVNRKVYSNLTIEDIEKAREASSALKILKK
jgi:hypothetical protein